MKQNLIIYLIWSL